MVQMCCATISFKDKLTKSAFADVVFKLVVCEATKSNHA